MSATDKIDLSLDDIIKLQKKQKQQQKRGATTAGKLKQFRGKVGNHRLRGGAALKQGVSPLNRQKTARKQATGRQNKPLRGRGVTPRRGRGVTPSRGRGVTPSRGRGVTPSRGRGVTPSRGRGVTPSRGRGMTPSRGRGRGRGQGLVRNQSYQQRGQGQKRGQQQGRLNKGRRTQYATTQITAATVQRQQNQRQKRQTLQNQKRGLVVNQQQVMRKRGQQSGRGRAHLTLNRGFQHGMMHSDLIVTQQNQQNPRWGKTNQKTTAASSSSVLTVSLPNQRSNDVQVQVSRGQQQTAGQQRGGLVQRGRGGRQRGRGRNQQQQTTNTVQQAISNLKPAKKQHYQYKVQDFGKAQTSMTMSERFASLGGNQARSTFNSSTGRQVFM